MNNLEQLTAKREKCEHLMKLGIIPAAFLWWIEDEQSALIEPEEGKERIPVYEVAAVVNPSPGPECVPAWTKAELDVMIGPDFNPKPDLFTKAQFGNSKLLKPESYPVFFIKNMQVYDNGADASADALTFLMEEGLVKAADANKRLQKVFRPFKK